MTADQNFAANLRALRARLGLTLKELSDASGLDPAVISKLENLHRDPALRRHLMPLATAFRTTEVELLSPVSVPRPDDDDPLSRLLAAVARGDRPAFLLAVADVLSRMPR